MKKYIFILVMFLAVQGMAQNNLIKLWNEKYIPYCDSLVYDTVIETGTVYYQISEKNGDIKLIPKDTIWEKHYCRDYYIIKYSDNNDFLSTQTPLFYYADCTNAISFTSTYIPETILSNQFTSEITRENICTMKYKHPDFPDFWVWLRENKYIK